jgi:hypothetical protein
VAAVKEANNRAPIDPIDPVTIGLKAVLRIRLSTGTSIHWFREEAAIEVMNTPPVTIEAHQNEDDS